jgi:hypothetical protein
MYKKNQHTEMPPSDRGTKSFFKTPKTLFCTSSHEEGALSIDIFRDAVKRVLLPFVLIQSADKCSGVAGSGLGEATCSGSAWSAPGAQMRFADVHWQYVTITSILATYLMQILG